MDGMRKITYLTLSLTGALIIILAGCGGGGENAIPTQAQLPTLLEGETVSPAPEAIAQAATLPASYTPTPSPTNAATATPTATVTFTPSSTITQTATRTATRTPLPTPVPNLLLNLMRTAAVATILPATFQITPGIGGTPFAGFETPGGPVAPGGPTSIAVTAIASQCPTVPGGFGVALANNPTLASQLGCAVGLTPIVITRQAASQTFERGAMIYLSGTPGQIYALYNNGTYQRFDDTYNPATDPVSGAQTPPAGLIEPVRGFGKVWRNNDGVRSALGWGTTAEAGTNAGSMDFQRGQMIYLPTRGDILVLIPDPGNPAAGTWRAVPGSI
jgi:serine/threonine-protein kinase